MSVYGPPTVHIRNVICGSSFPASKDKFRGTNLQEGSPPDGVSGVDLGENIEDLVAELYLPLLLGPRQRRFGRVKVHQVVHDVDLKMEGEYIE